MALKTGLAALLAASSCAALAKPVPLRTTGFDASGLVEVARTPGGSILYFDPRSLRRGEGANAVSRAVIVTDNRAYAASASNPAAQVSSRNTMEVRCRTGELRIAAMEGRQKDGSRVAKTYTEAQFAFAKAPAGSSHAKIVTAVCGS